MSKKDMLYEGKAKKIFKTENEEEVLMVFKDSATAFDGVKKGKIVKKGYYNTQISAIMFQFLESHNIKTHFVKLQADNEMISKKLDMIPVEVVVRNTAAGSLCKRYGIEEGKELEVPIIEYYLKNDELHDPMLNEYHIKAFGYANEEDLKEMTRIAAKINAVMKDYFLRRNIKLVDFKLEFGKSGDDIILGDEITPDTCRFWDAETNKKLDKDRFRFDLGEVEDAYDTIYKKVMNIEEEAKPEEK